MPLAYKVENNSKLDLKLVFYDVIWVPKRNKIGVYPKYYTCDVFDFFNVFQILYCRQRMILVDMSEKSHCRQNCRQKACQQQPYSSVKDVDLISLIWSQF